MKKLLLLIILALVVAIQPSYAAENTPFTIDATDYIIFDEQKGIIEAAGDVVIELKPDSIRADQIQIDLNAEIIRAKGNIVLKTEEREMTGEALEYDYRKEEGQVFDSEMEEGQLSFFGEVINIKEDELLLEETYLTSCNKDKPHYRLTAEKITVYPEEKLVAEGTYLWINERRVMPLPRYKQSLKEGEEDKHTIPQPQVGYSEADGLYVGIDYHHFINQDFSGDVAATATTNQMNRIDLDYLYQDDKLKVAPRIYYHQDYGLETYLNLENKIGESTVSDFAGRYYIERDDEENDYRERLWSGRWDLQTKLLNNELNLNLEQDQDDEAMQETLTYGNSWDDYYWQLEANRNRDVNRQPEFSLGINNRDLGDGNLLSAGAKIGEIEEDGEEARREQFSLELRNSGKEITDSTELYWAGRIEDSHYIGEDEYDYRNYAFNLGANQKLGPTDLNIDYRYYDELGESPFEFDRLTDEDMGRRDYLSGRLSGQHEVTESLDFDWQVQGAKRVYEGDQEKGREEQEYNSYGYRTGVDYAINEYHQVSLGYRYQQYSGSTPLEDDEIDYTSHLEGSYRFQTNELVYPYSDVEINAGYDLKEGELDRLQYSLIREFDCFSAQVGVDQVNREVNFGLELKY
ncbi:hypothetical protein MWH25_07220 [Natroniella acetigena]|uniref:LptA/OstA family protein n=1 Tax=Natroniella acetigena TaxID=52004 RepID=UPI00200AC1B7|nr:LptA/OstA family protein [Natroniella acetigena]MCK8827531.1 hypothetical protein [Natroniella acetigena]